MLSGSLRAQYSVVVHCPSSITGRLDCTFYSNDSVPHTIQYRIIQGECTFEGSAPTPYLVQLSHPSLAEPVPFYIENSNIDITIDPSSPASSRITGSRANSRYRYALEECPTSNAYCITQLVAANPAEIFTPFAIYNHLGELTVAQFQQLFQQLQGDALHTYHYHQLAKRLSSMQATTEGMRMPDFVFTTDEGNPMHFDSVRNDTTASIILFTASFSDKGRQIADQLSAEFPQLHTTIINIDSDPHMWDAPYLDYLSVDRIPYMILLDNHGTIHTRDARIWELKRLLKY